MNQGTPSATLLSLQISLFDIFTRLFLALVGRDVSRVRTEDVIKGLMMDRVKTSPDRFRSEVNAMGDEISAFYARHSIEIFQKAKMLGGMRMVYGGQRAFRNSALDGVRLTGLYADTHLIPDPIWPYFHGDLHLNARELQLALSLFNLLQLRPLFSDRFSTLPVVVFPSFEERLEEEDPVTRRGIERLCVQVVAPTLDGTLSDFAEIRDFIDTHGESFMNSALASHLFVPPGGDPRAVLSADEAIHLYFDGIEGIRDPKYVAQMKSLPPAHLMMVVIMERLRPQYHLLENAGELRAQPLLTQPAHWHYFELCGSAASQQLVNQAVLSSQAAQTLRSLQDDSLSWLANIPVSTLADLIANHEHRALRLELDSFTAQVSTGDASNLDSMVRELNFGLETLVGKQNKIMNDIRAKYTPKRASSYAALVAAEAFVGAAVLLPSFAGWLGSTIPAIAAVVASGSVAVDIIKSEVAKQVELSQARKTMLGVLAQVRQR